MTSFLLTTLLVFNPEPLVAERAVIDRGEVRIGAPLADKFVLKNRGQETLTITEVTSSCGCLAPRLERRTLAPGEETTLRVEINTLSQPPGPIGWPVRVAYSAGPATGVVDLTLKALLISEIRVEPSAIGFRIRQSRSTTITLTDARSKPLHVLGVGASCQQLKAELLPIDKSNTFSVRVTANPEGAAGTRSEIVWINTDDPVYAQIKIAVTLTVLPRHP